MPLEKMQGLRIGLNPDEDAAGASRNLRDRAQRVFAPPQKLGELAMAELALVDEIAKRSVSELNPIRTARKARRARSDKRN
jgi:hypothetical protein